MSNLRYSARFTVLALDFVAAGNAASSIRKTLLAQGFDAETVRRAAISAYEAEMNMVIHGGGGKMLLNIWPERIEIIASDTGPGIEDVQLALQEGFTTASDEIRELGFGAGMGLPNIKRCVDSLVIRTRPGQGTKLIMRLKPGDKG